MGAPPASPPPVENVSKVKAATITKWAAITGIVTIVVCYILAVREGHVPKWLPMISDCAVYPPESYLFRVGIISSALMIFVTSVLFYFFLSSTTGRHRFDDKVGVFLAGLATLGLALVGAINEDENGTVHGASAVVFFTAFIFYMILSTVRLWRYKNPNFTVSKTSLTIKATTTVIGFVALIAFALMSSNWGKYSIDIAICEWVGTMMILLFVLSYNLDFGDNEYVASLLVDMPAAPPAATPAGASAV